MLLVNGKVKGSRKVDSVDRKTGEIRTKWFIGFASPKENGYDGEEVLTEVQVSKSLYDKGLVAHYEKVIGLDVVAPIFITTFAGQKQVFVNYFFSGDGRPVAAPKPAAQVGKPA